MSWLYQRIVRPRLFRMDSEMIHNRTLRGLSILSGNRLLCRVVHQALAAPALPVELFGLRFPNPIGLAAGMDKQAEALPAWAALGFGFAEIGGVTWQAQPGNPKPRIFRAIADGALVNRMGFNNGGAVALAARLAEWKGRGRWPAHPVGVNLGKSKVTPLEEAADDYAKSFDALWDYGDFFVVNVSSPNTPNLRQLQDRAALQEILARLREINARRAAAATGARRRPILVKVAPDLSFEALDEIVALGEEEGLAGLVATNTTVARPQTGDSSLQRVYAETGGLSGRPLFARAVAVVRHLARSSQGKLPIIGVGGIFTAEDAWEFVSAGASLIQVYTGLVYEGPQVVRSIGRGLVQKMRALGLESWAEVIERRRI